MPSSGSLQPQAISQKHPCKSSCGGGCPHCGVTSPIRVLLTVRAVLVLDPWGQLHRAALRQTERVWKQRCLGRVLGRVVSERRYHNPSVTPSAGELRHLYSQAVSQTHHLEIKLR